MKRLFRDAGVSPGEIDNIAASLRRGFVTLADMAGAATAQIRDVTGHREPKSLRRYTRRDLLHDPVCRNSSTPKYARHTIRQEPQVPNADRAAREAAPRVTIDRERGRWRSSLRSATAWEDAQRSSGSRAR
jgi:hypothetical protein